MGISAERANGRAATETVWYVYMYSELDEPAPKFKLAVFVSTANVLHHDKCSNLNRKEIGNIELFSGKKLNKYW